jgi:hypothetical protein
VISSTKQQPILRCSLIICHMMKELVLYATTNYLRDNFKSHWLYWEVGVRVQAAVWSGMNHTNGMAPGYNRSFAVVPQWQRGRARWLLPVGRRQQDRLYHLSLTQRLWVAAITPTNATAIFIHFKGVGHIQDNFSYNYLLLQKQCLPL